MREIRANEDPRAYQKILDIHTMAAKGKSVEDGMGSERKLSRFDDIVFLPAQLAKLPLLDSDEVELKTVIGSDAAKPLEIDFPVMLSGMSFGALSREVKIALAKASAEVGISANSGEGGMLDEERKFAKKYILQLASGRFGQTPERFKLADAAEIKISQSAKPAKGGVLRGAKVTAEIAEVRGLKKGEDAISPARHPDISSPEDLKKKVTELREITGGKPIGIKLAGGRVEADLEVALAAEPDYLVLDGFGGGTGAAPKFIKDNVSIPHPAFLVRARKFLEKNPPKRKTSIIVAGGFRTSADIAKALALGADAVYIASAALIALGCEQYRLCHLGSCPTAIATQDPNIRSAFNIDERVARLVNFLKTLKHEISDFARIVGKSQIHDLNTEDIIALTTESAKTSDISFINS